MVITPYGAAGEVTGSAYCVETSTATVLVDFGMFQGNAELEAMNIVPRDLQPRHIDAIVLTHGHLDHCGRLPMLIRRGYANAIYTTDATIELADLILHDAAHIMESDYERKVRKAQKKGIKINRDDAPLFTADDVDRTIQLMKPTSYGAFVDIAPGISIRLHEAGHMLGSTTVEMQVTDDRGTRTVVFSGDVGPNGLPFLRDPEPPAAADIVVMESTYGDRNHPPLAETVEQFKQILKQVISQKGKIFIPSFAIGRTQQILFHLAELFRNGDIPHIPIYLDSPMAIEASRIYARHTDLFDEESTALSQSGQMQHDLGTLRLTATAEESKAINDAKGPFVVIAGSGMCTAGRILHHLRANLHDPNSHVVIVGFQSRGSLGRRLVDGQEVVSVLGDRIKVQAQIHTLGGFSAHAGQGELLDWFGHLAGSAPRLILTHGEDDARHVLASRIKERYGIDAILPRYANTLQF